MKHHLLALTTLITIGLASCTPDACENVTCLNDGICESGDYVCATGFEGPNCATEQRQAFVGIYSASETCNLGDFTYDITITADSETKTEITLSNLGDFDFEITGTDSPAHYQYDSTASDSLSNRCSTKYLLLSL